MSNGWRRIRLTVGELDVIKLLCRYKDCPIIMYPSSNAATISSSAAVLNKMFQRYYRGANHKTFLSNCKKVGIIEIPIRKKTGEPRGYAFDKMKDGKKYKVLKIKKAAFENIKRDRIIKTD